MTLELLAWENGRIIEPLTEIYWYEETRREILIGEKKIQSYISDVHRISLWLSVLFTFTYWDTSFYLKAFILNILKSTSLTLNYVNSLALYQTFTWKWHLIKIWMRGKKIMEWVVKLLAVGEMISSYLNVFTVIFKY